MVYFYYRYFNNLIGEEFLELFMWTMCHLIIFGLDAFSILIYFLIMKIKDSKKQFELVEDVSKPNNTTTSNFMK